MAENGPSYHDLYITTARIERTSIFNLPFHLHVHCCRTAGWELWDVMEGIINGKVVAGEYAGEGKGLRLDIGGHVIVDSLTEHG